MFYVEVQLDTAGQLVDVKVAHHGENPAVSTIFYTQHYYSVCLFGLFMHKKNIG